MANKRIPADRMDSRTFAEHQHVPIYFGGISKDRGRNGREQLLPYVGGGIVFIKHTGVTASDVIDCGDLPGNLMIHGVINCRAVAAGTLTLALEAISGGPGAATICTTQSLTTTGHKTVNVTENTVTRKLTATFASLTVGGNVLFAVQVTPLDRAFT
jgi:hypothetical protein